MAVISCVICAVGVLWLVRKFVLDSMINTQITQLAYYFGKLLQIFGGFSQILLDFCNKGGSKVASLFGLALCLLTSLHQPIGNISSWRFSGTCGDFGQ